MIYTVTFNPALDYVVHVSDFKKEAVNRTTSEEIQYGGKGINVSAVLKNLGVSSTALGFLAGFTGKALEEGLKGIGLATDFIWLSRGLTRINVKIKSNVETEINGQGPVITEDALQTLIKKLDKLTGDDILIISGSVPSTLSHDVYKNILAGLQNRGTKFVVDSTKDLLCNALPYHPFLIKPNNIELGEIFGKELNTDEEILEGAKKLQEMGAANVLVSMAGDGSLLLDENGKHHRLGVPYGKVKNSVGAGDSMVAGFIAGWLQTGDYGYAQRLGTAAGSATAFSEGLAAKEQIQALLDKF